MKEIHFACSTILTTERLILRQLKNSDDIAISSLRSDDSVNKYIERPKQTSKAEAKAFITRINEGIKQNKWIYRAICLKDSQELIGTICVWKFSEDKLSAELGYELNPGFQGQGLMNEAVKCIIQFSFETLGIKTLEAFVHKDNTKSEQVLVKNNFKLDSSRNDSENKNNVIFTLTAK
ncbi:MAG: hypothetical protein A3F72_16115 [Bacteroidetes bacterium RIFCSPLOWO2_12_FULL_35_15]|nr:MAG: hypothetical protein A3F72_16115 [Bacteroidetes bacterium RIFCSPLOWO2_12_FULL_35_15]